MVELFPLWARKKACRKPRRIGRQEEPRSRSGKRPRPRQVRGSTALLPATRGPWARAAPTRAALARAAAPWQHGRPWRSGPAPGPLRRPLGTAAAARLPEARPRPAPTAAARPWRPRALHPPAWAAFPRPFPRAAPAPGGRPPPGAEPGPSSSSRCPAPGPGYPAAEAVAVLTQTASWECCSPLGPAREKKNVFQAPSPLPGPDSSIYSP